MMIYVNNDINISFLYHLIFFNILILFNAYYLEKICLHLYIIFPLIFHLYNYFENISLL